MHRKTWDIFCKVVDNFGDIGVCWRLARQLAHEHDLRVRLFVDDLQVASKIIHTINLSNKSQVIDNIEIALWSNETVFTDLAEVVLEAFACELPQKILELMSPKTIWVNLEYLSAEPWVADFHGRHSKVGELKRYFYFPGFSENTGGLIRERDAFFAKSSMHADSSKLSISLFCYPNAPISDLLNVLKANNNEVLVHVPASSILPKVTKFFGKDSAEVGEVLTQDNLNVKVLPFLSQDKYDQLLRACDLNLVRGEDSWVRAIWAGKPFVWQPYVQSENTHITKLNAFLEVFYAENQLACEVHRYWSAVNNVTQNSNEIWRRYLSNLPSIQAATQIKSMQLAHRTDLATKLVEFCINA